MVETYVVQAVPTFSIGYTVYDELYIGYVLLPRF